MDRPLVYVAGASAEVERAEAIIRELRSRGFTITHDWTHSVRKNRALGYRESALSAETRAELVAEDLAGVRRADVFLFLAPAEDVVTRGAWVELGCASNLGNIVIFVSGANARESMFTELADYIFDDDDAALQALTNVAS